MSLTTRNIPASAHPFPGAISRISPDTRLDVQYCALLLLLTAVMLLPGSLTLPMELWDESRNANNAMEIARHGGWMVPTFDGLPDHWNTKPPLLIWMIAGLLRIGLDPMLAVRLPSVVATMASVVLGYCICRIVIHDRLAGLLSGLLMICSVLFMGDHVGRTGDYDAMLSLLSLGFVMSVGRYIDAAADRSAGWIAAAGALLFLAIMTKGVAAGLPVPGLLAYAIARRRFVPILRDWRLWATVVSVAAGVAAYLALREQLDPGYLTAVWNNDVAGRMLVVLDQHSEQPWFYLEVLGLAFQPGILLAPMLLTMRHDNDSKRRTLCLLMCLSAASWLITLSCASTKIYWYAAPMVPLLAIAIATGTTTYLRAKTPALSGRVVIRPIVVAMLLTFCYLNVRTPDQQPAYASGQLWYGSFLGKVRDKTSLSGMVIIDRGLPNDAGFVQYNPIARFFAADAARRGERIQIAAPDVPIAADETVVTCDPEVRDWLKSRRFFAIIVSDSRCVAGRVSTPPEYAQVPEGY